MTETEKKQFAAARRGAILSGFPRLNEMQRQAAAATEGPLLVLAGAGSGKTTVLIQRTANLMRFGRGSDTNEVPEGVTPADTAFLESYARGEARDDARMEALCAVEPAEPWRILAITFTNKAAGELRDRLEQQLGETARDIWAMTFHSACARILRRDIDRLGYGKDFTIYDSGDSQSTVKHLMRDLEIDEKALPVRTVLTYISNAKGELLSAEAFLQAAGADYRKKQVGAIYAAYEKRLKAANAVDFDDLLLLTVRLFTECEDVRAYYARRFRYVLIDEYQDTNKLQYLFAACVASGHGNICVVGDDDQSIYKFRGATIENILNFEKQYPAARVIRLEQNYRSTGHILDASNAVIRNNQGRKGKELWTEHDRGEKLRLFAAEDEREEAQFVASQILAGYSSGGRWRDFAVLYRMNALSNQLEYAFKRNGIPYRVVGGMRFFDRAEVKDVLSWLCVINNPSDTLRLTRTLDAPPRGIGQKTLETALALAAERGISLWEVFDRVTAYPELSRSAARVGQLVELVNDLRQAATELPVDALYDQVLERTGYLRALEAKNTDEDRARAENVAELRTNIAAYIKETGDATLHGFLDEVALYTDLDAQDADADCASLMTIHSAKGLEFPVVFVVAAEDGIFPGSRAIGEPEELEEERRLCYVAMTRAKEKLYLTCARRRMLFGRTMPNPLSRFVKEIPPEDLDAPAPRTPASGQESGDGYSQRVRPVPRERRHIPEPERKYAPAFPSEQPAAPSDAGTACRVGDRVRHKAFGEGKVLSLKPVGGDTLIVVEFASGQKRMMLKYALQHMEVL